MSHISMPTPGAEINWANTDHDAALHLFHVIAEAEHWWDGQTGTPTRDEILDCYADCLAAVRTGQSPLLDTAIMFNRTTDAARPSETPAYGATQYEASQDLAPPAPKGRDSGYVVIDHRQNFEA